MQNAVILFRVMKFETLTAEHISSAGNTVCHFSHNFTIETLTLRHYRIPDLNSAYRSWKNVFILIFFVLLLSPYHCPLISRLFLAAASLRMHSEAQLSFTRTPWFLNILRSTLCVLRGNAPWTSMCVSVFWRFFNTRAAVRRNAIVCA